MNAYRKNPTVNKCEKNRCPVELNPFLHTFTVKK
jgi:hypothetical protein